MIRVEYAVFLGCRCAEAFDSGEHDASRSAGRIRDALMASFDPLEVQVFSAWARSHIVVEELRADPSGKERRGVN